MSSKTKFEDDKGKPIATGTILSTSKAQYVLDELLGEGKFGLSYKVYSATDMSKNYEMKLEKRLNSACNSKLKSEIYILKLVADKRKSKSHFTAIVDHGKNQNFRFLVTQLVGKTLNDMQREQPSRCFSLGTSLGIGIQALEALEDLHRVGFLHRDVKPSSYACGIGDKTHVIYLLDFGMPRRYLNAKRELRSPRRVVNFKGTVRYASIACHRNQELAPKDDCESWIYMVIDLMSSAGLPWRKLDNQMTVLRSKDACRKDRESFLPKFECRDELSTLLDYIDKQTYSDKIDYSFFYHSLRLSAEIEQVNVNDPFDWERPIVCAKELSSKTTIRDSQARSLVPKSRTRNRVNVTADSYIPAKKRNPKTDKKLAHSALQKFKKRHLESNRSRKKRGLKPISQEINDKSNL